jgi:hypothetical protein
VVVADRPLLEVESNPAGSELFQRKFKGTVTHGTGGVFVFRAFEKILHGNSSDSVAADVSRRHVFLNAPIKNQLARTHVRGYGFIGYTLIIPKTFLPFTSNPSQPFRKKLYWLEIGAISVRFMLKAAVLLAIAFAVND